MRGHKFKDICRFDCNGDKGLTWPEVADKSSTFKCNEKFDYPNIPLKTDFHEKLNEVREATTIIATPGHKSQVTISLNHI